MLLSIITIYVFNLFLNAVAVACLQDPGASKLGKKCFDTRNMPPDYVLQHNVAETEMF